MPLPNDTTFDERLARAILHDGESGRGLPATLGFVATRLEPGRLTVEVEARAEHMNPFAVAHGGLVAALVDHCTGVVVWPLCPPGQWPATTEVSTHLLAPVPVGPVVADAEVRSLRAGTAIVDVQVEADGRLVAMARGTVRITRPRTGAGAGQDPGVSPGTR